MARYADTLLADGERIVLRSRQHPLAPIVEGRRPWLLFLASVVVSLLATRLDDGLRTAFGWLAVAGIVVSMVWLGKVYWNWLAQDYLVTNRRVLKVEGIINKRSADSSLEKINDAVLEQGLLGRMLNFGNLEILTAAEVAVDKFDMLAGAPAFKREILNQKHDLEEDVARAGLAPSPPPSPAAPGAPAAPAMDPHDVTETLERLADLRDRGAITAEEYEAKKADLLRRL